MENKFSPTITEILNYGKQEAMRLHSKRVEPSHLLLAMMRETDCTAFQMLMQMGVDMSSLKKMLEGSARGASDNKDPLLSEQATRVMKLMMLEARAM